MKDPDEINASQLLIALKAMLRERGMTYSDLSSGLEVSLPTVKRWLNKPTLPLDRLLAICRLAGVEMDQLLERCQRDRPRHTVFTPEQDHLFFHHPCCLGYFSELFFEGRSPDQIAEQYNLNQLSTDLYLAQLARAGLLERQTGNRIRFLVHPPLGFAPESKVLRRIQEEFLERIVHSVVRPDPEDRLEGSFAILKPFQLSASSWKDMLQDLTEIVDRYAFLSESGAPRSDVSTWQLAIAAGPGLPPESLDGLESEQCRIRNLNPEEFRPLASPARQTSPKSGIRPARDEDVPSLCGIYNHYVEHTIISFEEVPITVEEMRGRLRRVRKNYPWLVLEEGDEILGYAYASTWNQRSAYGATVESSIYLSPHHLGKGRGKKLYRALLEELRSRKFHAVLGGVTVPNPASRALHQQLGFQHVALLREVGRKFDQWIDVEYWELLLNSPSATPESCHLSLISPYLALS